MDTKRTPGVWHAKAKFSPFRGKHWIVCTEDNQTLICRTDNEADARAIAAVPVLLEVLRVAHNEGPAYLKQAIGQALKIATGE